MENKKGNEIFLGVVGVATLIVAIIGATFAYFSASASSNNDSISTKSANLSLGYAEDVSKLSTNLIPTADNLAMYAGTNKDWIDGKTISYQVPKLDEDGEPIEGQFETKTSQGKGLCKDDNNNEICGVYTFTIGNPNFHTAMNIQGKVISTKNEFKNIWFRIYDEQNNPVGAATKFPEDGKDVPITIDQQLLGSSKDVLPDGSAKEGFDEKDPTTYTKLCTFGEETKAAVLDTDGETVLTPAEYCTVTNVRTYKMVIWVHEAGTDQTADDSGKMLTAAVKIETESGAGVTGVIAAADAN